MRQTLWHRLRQLGTVSWIVTSGHEGGTSNLVHVPPQDLPGCGLVTDMLRASTSIVALLESALGHYLSLVQFLQS